VEYRHRVRTSAISEGQRQNRKNKLVAAIAVGKPIAAWARENKVSRRTAYRWAKDPRVKSAVEARRRKAVDHSVGVLTGRLARAANCIAELGEYAESESVRLSANKAVYSTMIHPRCLRVKEAFQTYSRQRRGGEWINYPADSHPEEDLIDALRAGIRDAFPDGLAPRPSFTSVHASRLLG
jgi:hypothetical protein